MRIPLPSEAKDYLVFHLPWGSKCLPVPAKDPSRPVFQYRWFTGVPTRETVEVDIDVKTYEAVLPCD